MRILDLIFLSFLLSFCLVGCVSWWIYSENYVLIVGQFYRSLWLLVPDLPVLGRFISVLGGWGIIWCFLKSDCVSGIFSVLWFYDFWYLFWDWWDYWAYCLMMNTAVFLKTAYPSRLSTLNTYVPEYLPCLCYVNYGWSVCFYFVNWFLFLEGSIFLCTLYPYCFWGWILCERFGCVLDLWRGCVNFRFDGEHSLTCLKIAFLLY